MSRVMRTGIVVALLASAACDDPDKARIAATTQFSYDKVTGRLTRVTADLNKNGRIDTWTYMDGPAILRSESDLDEDGKIDRWEFNAPDGKILKIAQAVGRTGTKDMWIYPDAAGRPGRIEFMASGDGTRVRRWEFYEAGRLVRVDEDTNGDGRPDKWEVHDGVAVTSVEFDVNHDGVRDRRITYGAGGRVILTEMEPDGRGGYKKKIVPSR